ncbi:hypothetical protein H4218_005430 [Coemansia sp. IMI 209128]|nr:hypothetical protein H4218_005430 [Coemansia sp. IMI 209128]
MDRGVVEMLHVNGVFESNRKALKVVVVREIDNHQDISLTSKAILSKFLHCFSRHAQYMTLLPSLLTSFPMPGSKYGDSFTNVQVLDMSSRALSFFEILRLLKTFPILRKLVCCIDGLGIESEHIPENKVPDYIVATHRDIGKSLQIWCMSGFNGQSSCDILEYIMLLALVCPKFYRADVNLGLIPNYNARLSAALESGPYSKYSPRLAGLLMREM